MRSLSFIFFSHVVCPVLTPVPISPIGAGAYTANPHHFEAGLMAPDVFWYTRFSSLMNFFSYISDMNTVSEENSKPWFKRKEMGLQCILFTV